MVLQETASIKYSNPFTDRIRMAIQKRTHSYPCQSVFRILLIVRPPFNNNYPFEIEIVTRTKRLPYISHHEITSVL